MKSGKLQNALAQIDERYILEAKPNHFETRSQPMTSAKIIPFFRKPAAMAAALAVFLCIGGTTVLAAAGHLPGFFENIRSWNGAIVGTTYTQASSELALTAVEASPSLTLQITITDPGKFPYRDLEMLGIARFQILDSSGNVIAEETSAEMVPITNGTAFVSIPSDSFGTGTYRLLVSQLIGGRKADQPLVLSGHWECTFTR